MSRLEAIFFDHDGTLVDTEPLWAEAKAALAADYGKTWTEEDSLACLGRPATVTFERMHALGIDAPADELYASLKEKMGVLLSEATITLLEGIPELLNEVAAAGVPAGIVTNATTAVAQRTANLGPEGLFSTIVSDEHVTQAKPNPEPYLLAAKNLGVNPANCVAIEDSDSGTQSAVDAGMKVVVVPGLLSVPKNLGHARMKHSELSLAKIRALMDED